MTNNSPCGCGDDHTEEKDAPAGEEAHECCGGGHCGTDDDSQDDACGCGHDHEHDMPAITPEEMEKLKAAIIEAGYKIEETADGEIKIIGE